MPIDLANATSSVLPSRGGAVVAEGETTSLVNTTPAAGTQAARSPPAWVEARGWSTTFRVPVPSTSESWTGTIGGEPGDRDSRSGATVFPATAIPATKRVFR